MHQPELSPDSFLPRRLTWTAGQVAYALGLSEPTFRKKRLDLEQGCNFPAKLPGLNAWSIAAVTSWVRSNGGGSDPVDALAPLSIASPELAAATASLEGLYWQEGHAA